MHAKDTNECLWHLYIFQYSSILKISSCDSKEIYSSIQTWYEEQKSYRRGRYHDIFAGKTIYCFSSLSKKNITNSCKIEIQLKVLSKSSQHNHFREFKHIKVVAQTIWGKKLLVDADHLPKYGATRVMSYCLCRAILIKGFYMLRFPEPIQMCPSFLPIFRFIFLYLMLYQLGIGISWISASSPEKVFNFLVSATSEHISIAMRGFFVRFHLVSLFRAISGIFTSAFKIKPWRLKAALALSLMQSLFIFNSLSELQDRRTSLWPQRNITLLRETR